MFWFRLAGHLKMTVREAQQKIDRAEFCEWMAFNRMDPFAGFRLDMLAAAICQAIRPQENRGLKDYAVTWAEPDAEPPPVDQSALAQKIHAAFAAVTAVNNNQLGY